MDEPTQVPGGERKSGSEITPFIVARRVRTLFEASAATRSFSTGLCAKQVYSKGKDRNDKTPMGELKTVDETEDANSGVQQEDISNLLDNLNFRFNETCELSAEQPDKPAGDNGGKSKRQSNETKNSEHKNSGSKAGKAHINRWRVGTKLADHSDDGLGSRDFLSQLQGQLQKESISSLQERLAERKLKDDTKPHDAVRPKGEGKKKLRKKKEASSGETDQFDEDRITSFATQKVRSKLVSLQRFKGT